MTIPRARARLTPLRLHPTKVLTRGIPDSHGIYRIVCLPLRMAYIGQAYSLLTRAMEHQQQLRDGVHTNHRLQAAYDIHGADQFAFQVLELWRGRYSPDCLSPAEQRWMDAHGQASLFNIRPAGSDSWLKATDNSARGRTTLDGSQRSRPQGRANAQTEKDWRHRIFKKRP